jgi:hypothetical protein
MTPAQKKALRRYRKKLQQALAEAAATATTPGNQKCILEVAEDIQARF